MRTLERRVANLEKAIPAKPCPVHGEKLGIYLFWAERDGEKRAAEYRQEIEACPNCRDANPLFVTFLSFSKGASAAPVVPLGERQSFTLDFGEPAPEMPRITFNRFDKEDVN